MTITLPHWRKMALWALIIAAIGGVGSWVVVGNLSTPSPATVAGTPPATPAQPAPAADRPAAQAAAPVVDDKGELPKAWESTKIQLRRQGIPVSDDPWVVAISILFASAFFYSMVKVAWGPSGWPIKLIGILAWAIVLIVGTSLLIFGVTQTTQWFEQGRNWVTGRNPTAITTAPVGQIGVWYPGQFSPRGGFQVSAAEDVGVHSCLVYDDAANRALSGQIPPGEYTLKQEKSTGAVLISAHPKVAAYYAAREEPVKIKYIRTRGVPTRC